ncbi:MAG: hypothetical protein ACOCZ6_05820 [Nanoarchaeota archaeon]
MLRRERPEPEGRASHRSVTDGGRGLLTYQRSWQIHIFFSNYYIINWQIKCSPG